MYIRNVLIAAVVLAGSLLLTACATTWKVTGKCKSGGECEIGGEVGGTFEKGGASVDVSQLSIFVDATGTFPATGVVTVFAKNAAGSTVGTASFPWTRSGDTIRIADPVSANAWLNTMTTATSATFQLDPVNVQEQTGVNSLDVGLSYAGQLKAFQTTVWSSTTSCGRVGTCIEQ